MQIGIAGQIFQNLQLFKIKWLAKETRPDVF